MPALNDQQFAAHISKEGGGSVDFHTREPVTGHGFMTALPGGEHTSPGGISAKDVTNFRAKHAGLAADYAAEGHQVAHGAWGDTQDVSVKAPTPNAARKIGQSRGEMASYALPGTRVSSRGHHVKEGGDVLLHTGSLGKNDSDPRYQPGKLDTPGKGSFTRNEYQNKDWNKVGGTLNGKPVSYGDVLKKVNDNRAEKVRKNVGR